MAMAVRAYNIALCGFFKASADGDGRGRHGECEANLVAALHTHLGATGRVYPGDTGFILRESPTHLVSPNVAFVRHDRLPPAGHNLGANACRARR